ncbi:unnamed protein product [Parnassius mnemosyne]|uniref:CBF1-interacting co-repressor CIR N-terminal domain-containing protein n=1 Tax=Parnassius mnemosyne TaxID=213953 RepID=A0AAV1M764_9NEOP
MGGGDLNSKKAWHPSTLKNQERVWKAEQAAAEENKRILELQRERAEERDREELNKIAKRTSGSANSSNENRLHWMYDKPDKKVQHEDFLLGKSIDSNHDQTDKGNQDIIPAVARRVVGSSMIATSGDTQVDLARKLREDPLLLIKERERAARAALLNNPLQRRRLTELLRKEQEESKESKEKNKLKSKSKDLDNILAAKLNALGAKKGVDLTALLASDDSTSDSSSDEIKHKKRKKDKKKKKKKKKNKNNDKSRPHVDSEDSEKDPKNTKKECKKVKNDDKDSKRESTQHKRKKTVSENESDHAKMDTKKQRKDTTIKGKKYHDKYHHDSSEDDHRNSRRNASFDERGDKRYINRKEHTSKTRVGMSEEERAAKLAEMAAAGAEREIQRGRRVAEQLAEKEASEKSSNVGKHSRRKEVCSLPDSLESRIHSNRHYIQRDKRHMNEHFARR